MSDTKEEIIEAALSLFAENGYEAVSVSMIAGQLGLAKSALYRHFANKRNIFDTIVARMVEMDAKQAKDFQLPEGGDGEEYGGVTPEMLRSFCKAQFDYWTDNSFALRFRRLLTLEQFRSPEMAALYQQYLGSGPLGYTADIFREMTGDGKRAESLAMELYGSMYLMYGIYDGAEDKSAAAAAALTQIDNFFTKEAF